MLSIFVLENAKLLEVDLLSATINFLYLTILWLDLEALAKKLLFPDFRKPIVSTWRQLQYTNIRNRKSISGKFALKMRLQIPINHHVMAKKKWLDSKKLWKSL